MDRLYAYIDGFNLYYGLKEKNWKRYYWLNSKELCDNLSKPYQELVFTKYFTAKVKDPVGKMERQSTYLSALKTLTDFQVFYGHYLINKWKCYNCSNTIEIHKEKMTDVNIAVEIMTDAFKDVFDTALIISADSDLVGPVKKVKELFPEKKIVVGFPPGRNSQALKTVANAYLHIGRKKIAESIFPQTVYALNGSSYKCPEHWK